MAKWCGINGVHKDVQECKLNSALCECGKQPLSQIIERAVEGFFAAPRPGHQPSDLDAIIDAIRGVESGFDRDEARAILARALAAAPQAPSGQQAETDETWRRRAEHLDRELKAARVDVDSEIVEGQLKDFLLRFGGKYDGNGMWDVSLYLEDICQVMSALAASQAERPAEDGK